jgi:hypothetical protein
MENQFASAQAQIESGQLQLDLAQTQLDQSLEDAEEALALVEEAQLQLDEGWAEFEQGKADVILELEKARIRLTAADGDLKDAWNTIQTLAVPDVYALTRNTNVSYLSLESNSDIVEGVSAVFPAFFLLIAALVCTMAGCSLSKREGVLSSMFGEMMLEIQTNSMQPTFSAGDVIICEKVESTALKVGDIIETYEEIAVKQTL